MDSIFVLALLLLAAGVIAALALGPLGVFVGGALVLAAVGVGAYRVFKVVTRRTSSSEGVRRRS
jgi:hypothetical protein